MPTADSYAVQRTTVGGDVRPGTGPGMTRALVVAAREVLADGIVAVTLRDPDGEPLPSWAPGAHLDLVLTSDLTRQYSLCGDPEDRASYRVAVLREETGRGGSAHVHDRVAVGDRVEVAGPRNNFALLDSPRYLFIAGGIGITPILPMLAAASRAGAEWTLVYGGRSRSSMGFLPVLAAYGERVRVQPQDEVGLLDLAALLGEEPTDTLVYCCGPAPLLDAVEARCAGWRPGLLQVERFSAGELARPAMAGSFTVELAQSGRALEVPPDRSILQVLEEAGVQVLSSCQEGTCGTCETGVLSGVPDHRDVLLTEDERASNDTMFICVSRSRSATLVLDL